jgi:hypothetical protein
MEKRCNNTRQLDESACVILNQKLTTAFLFVDTQDNHFVTEQCFECSFENEKISLIEGILMKFPTDCLLNKPNLFFQCELQWHIICLKVKLQLHMEIEICETSCFLSGFKQYVLPIDEYHSRKSEKRRNITV